GGRSSGTESEKPFETLEDRSFVSLDLLRGEKLARFLLAGGIADLGRAAAHQHDRLVSRLLQAAQRHDLRQIADVQARRGAVETDVADNLLIAQALVERGSVGAIVILPPRRKRLQEIRLKRWRGGGHGAQRP